MAERRSSSTIWIVLVVALAAVAGGWAWYMHANRSNAPDYLAAAVARGDLVQLVTATGTLNPVTNVQVGCQVSGRVSKLYVDWNSQVTAGEVIAEIDPSTYKAAVDQAAADLANAKANLELQQAEAERALDLFTNKLISQSDRDTAVATLDEADATVKIKEAALTNAVANLGYCKIYSPVDGVVILRAVDVGQTVASSFNTPTLFQIANDLRQMQIDSSVAEADVGGVQEGQSVDFTVDAYPTRTFAGFRQAGAKFPDDREQRGHLRLCHQRNEFGFEIEAGHDGQRVHHSRRAHQCAEHSQFRATVPSPGLCRGGHQYGLGAQCYEPAQSGQRRQPAGASWPRGRTPDIPHGFSAYRAGQRPQTAAGAHSNGHQ